MIALRWEDPPPREQWAEIVAVLKRKPGQWAAVEDGATLGRCDYVRKTLRGLGCDVAVRKVSGAGRTIWARWPA